MSDRVQAWAAEGQLDALAALEALADQRLAGESGIPEGELAAELARRFPASSFPAVRGELLAAGAQADAGALRLPPEEASFARAALAQAAGARPVEWATRRLTQGEIFGAFEAHCRDELDDVEVAEPRPGGFTARWRREETQAELRFGTLFLERLPGGPWLLLGAIDDALCERYLDDADLRARVSVWDATRLEKIAAVRSSVLVYFEWFLRDAFGVKVLPAEAFTTGLVVRGIISLGMG